MKREELPNETPREDLMREALKHYEELATKACWHRSDIPDAIRAYYTPLPPAEGAEAFIRAKIADHKLHDCYPTFVPEMAQAMTEFAAQQQPTAEGAEDILEKHMKLCSIQPINGGYPKFVVLVAMTEFAEQLTTLYAQRIADKMVEERLRGELYPEEFIEWIGDDCSPCNLLRNDDEGFDKWVIYERDSMDWKFSCKTITELYKYWKKNEQ